MFEKLTGFECIGLRLYQIRGDVQAIDIPNIPNSTIEMLLAHSLEYRKIANKSRLVESQKENIFKF